MDWKAYLFSFQGRINRAKLWLYILIAIAAEAVFFVLFTLITGASVTAMVMSGASPDSMVSTGVSWILGALLAIAFFIVVIWTGLAVAVKRLHDRNKSAWWLVVFYVVPFLLEVIGAAVSTIGAGADQSNVSPVGAIFILVAVGIGIWAFVELYCLRGTVGDNRFGPDPLAAQAIAAQPA